jgi:hypothetical protein
MQQTKSSGTWSVQAEITIHAPLARVWSVLVDLERYSEWNTFVPSMRSSFQVGQPLTMRVHMRKGLFVTSVETITIIEPYHLLAWKTRSPAWFLQGERFQEVTALDEQTTRYWTREAFSGMVAPVIKTLFGHDLQRGFTAVANNLKARAESL